MVFAAMACPLHLGLRLQVERAALADVVEVIVKETAGSAAAASVEHPKEVVIGRELSVRRIGLLVLTEHDTMGVDAAVLTRAGAAFEPSVVDQARDKFRRADFGGQRRVEADLVDAIDDVAP
jgi:hypothetical protein